MEADTVYVEDKCHKISMFGMFQKYLRRSNMIDCRIFCEKGVLEAHKLLLAASSDFFENILLTGCSSVVLNNVTQDDMRTILQFIYCGKCVFHRSRMESVMNAARTLCIKNLIKVLGSMGEDRSGSETATKTTEMQQYANLVLVKDKPNQYQDSAVQTNFDPCPLDMDSIIGNWTNYIDDSLLTDDSHLLYQDPSTTENSTPCQLNVTEREEEPVELHQPEKLRKRASRSRSRRDGPRFPRGRPRKPESRSMSVPRSTKRRNSTASNATEVGDGDQRKSQILERIYFGYGTNDFCTHVAPNVPKRRCRSRSKSRLRSESRCSVGQSFAFEESSQMSEDNRDPRLKPRWKEDEVDLLLRLWMEEIDRTDQSDVDRKVVSTQLQAMGVVKTHMQISTKMSRLKYEYQKHLVGEKASTILDSHIPYLEKIFPNEQK